MAIVPVESNSGDVAKNLEAQANLYKRGIKLEMFRALTILEAAIKQNVRRRSGLHVRTGALLNSIQSSVVIEDGDVVGYIGSYGVAYAKTHEFGHSFPARKILPRNAKALSWIGGDGKRAFSRGHNMPAFRVPARPFIRPALEEKKELIMERFHILISTSFDTEK